MTILNFSYAQRGRNTCVTVETGRSMLFRDVSTAQLDEGIRLYYN